MRLRMPIRTETSSIDTGSSARIRAGEQAKAAAKPIR